MRENLNHIRLAEGVEYPLRCDWDVLEAAQDEFGKFSTFELKLAGLEKKPGKAKNGGPLYEAGEPSVKAVRFGLLHMVNEGIDIENRLNGEKRKHVTTADLNGMLDGVSVYAVAEELHEEFKRAFETKNLKST